MGKRAFTRNHRYEDRQQRIGPETQRGRSLRHREKPAWSPSASPPRGDRPSVGCARVAARNQGCIARRPRCRPRKSLDRKTATEVFEQQLRSNKPVRRRPVEPRQMAARSSDVSKRSTTPPTPRRLGLPQPHRLRKAVQRCRGGGTITETVRKPATDQPNGRSVLHGTGGRSG